MKCDCRDNIEQKVLENFKTQNPDAQDVCVSMGGYGFQLVGNGMRMLQMMPCKITYTNTVKKTGQQRTKQQTMNITGSYCMFCGKQVKGEQNDNQN